MAPKRALLFAAFFLVLAVLWCAGGASQRLIGSDAPPQPVQAEALPALPATLDVATDRAAAPGALARTEAAGSQQDPCILTETRDAAAARAPLCDANGNVLCALRYSRAVYAAFALGDMPG